MAERKYKLTVTLSEKDYARLNRLKKNFYHLETGFVGTPYLCRVLSENGMNDLAYHLLLEKGYPGWLYEVLMGATTVWERWNSVNPDGKISGTEMNSLNHYSYGAVIGWLFHGVCGIRLSAGKLVIEPQPGQELGFAKAKWKSPVGEIRSSWKYCGNTLMFDICVPIPATILLPNGETFAVKEGEHHYEILL